MVAQLLWRVLSRVKACRLHATLTLAIARSAGLFSPLPEHLHRAEIFARPAT
jgi:hypothetical protein